MLFSSILMAAMVGVSQAIDVQVVYVGKNPVNDVVDIKYWPEKITAAPGSMVQFQFWAGNHTITQSSFDAPCVPITQTANGTAVSAIKSGFMPTEESADVGQIPIYTVLINDTSPLWFYCGQGPHCANGMAMVINEKSDGPKTLDAYKASAAGPGEGDDAPSDDAPPSGDAPTEDAPADGDAPSEDVPADGGDDSSSGSDGSESEGEVPGEIPSNPDSSVGDGEVPQAGASAISLSWAVLLGAAIMFAL